MNCEEAAEFVSALCDGERIPRTAAEHVGACELCGTRLKEYLEMGAELRRVASLDSTELSPQVWAMRRRTKSSWWQKGWETMRIPMFAFALLLMTIVVLGSRLAIVRVRAQTQGPVLMLTVKSETGRSFLCPLLTQQEPPASCQGITIVKSGYLPYALTLISKDDDRVELGLRTRFIPYADATSQTVSTTAVQDQPENKYWFHPGGELTLDIPGAGPIVLAGEFMDHMPSIIVNDRADGELDPKPGELRVVSPVLLQNKKVIMDYEGFSSSQVKTRQDQGVAFFQGVVFFYTQREGLWVLSLSPLEGAVQGHVSQSRVSFEMNGASYEFLMAAPVSRNETIWVLHQPDYKPSGIYSGMPAFQGFAGSGNLSDLLPKNAAMN